MQRDPPFYAVLGLHRGASLKEIRAAYKERALAFHPDKNPGGEKAFKAIATAYDTLKDAGKRSAYDAEFNRQQQQSSSAAPASRPHRTPAQEQAAADNIMRDAFADYRRSAMAGNKSRPHDWYRRKTEEQENDLPSASASSSWMPQAGGAASSCQGAAHRFASSRGGNGSGSAPTPPPRGSRFRQHAQPSSSASDAGRGAAAPDAEEAPELPGFRPWKPASEAPQPSAAELLAKQKRQREAEEAVRRAADLRSEAAAAKERMLREARERRLAAERTEAAREAEAESAMEKRWQEAVARAAERDDVPVREAAAATEALREAVSRWDVPAVKKALGTPGVAADAPFRHAQLGDLITPLHCCAASAFTRSASVPHDTVHALVTEMVGLRGGSLMVAGDSVGRTPMHLAAANGSLALVRAFVAPETSMTAAALAAKDRGGARPLDFAASNGNLNAIEILLAAGAHVDGPADNKRRTPLHAAVRFGHASAANALIRAGANINAKDVMRWTPLHFAANDGCVDCVHALLHAGAAVSAKTPDGETPLDLARARGDAHAGAAQCAKMLFGAGRAAA